MLKKVFTGAGVAACVLALTLPAWATDTGTHVARLRPVGVTTGKPAAMARLRFNRRLGEWQGSIRVAKGELPAGSYAYVVEFHNVPTANGIAPTIGDTICEFDMFDDPPTANGCSGVSLNLTQGVYGQTNDAQVVSLLVPNKDQTVLEGALKH
jgi:hypothetical protein